MIDWKTVGQTIAKIAPILGTLIGGPVGGGIGAGVSAILSAVTGVPADQLTPEKVMAALKDPNIIVKIKEIEANQQVELQKLVLQQQQLETREYELELIDKQSARSREVELAKATGKKDYNLYAIAWLTIAGFYTLMYFLMTHPLPQEQNPVVYMLFGAIASGFGMVLQYFFGSSRGSALKTIQQNTELSDMRKKLIG